MCSRPICFPLIFNSVLLCPDRQDVDLHLAMTLTTIRKPASKYTFISKVYARAHKHIEAHPLSFFLYHTHTRHANLNSKAVCKQIVDIMGLFSVQTISC